MLSVCTLCIVYLSIYTSFDHTTIFLLLLTYSVLSIRARTARMARTAVSGICSAPLHPVCRNYSLPILVFNCFGVIYLLSSSPPHFYIQCPILPFSCILVENYKFLVYFFFLSFLSSSTNVFIYWSLLILMNVYIVQPNLEITNCENCPSEETLLSKKADYLANLNKCEKLEQLNGMEHVPSWCVSSSRSEVSSDSDDVQGHTHSNKHKHKRNHLHNHNHNHNHNHKPASDTDLDFQLQSFHPETGDYSKLDNDAADAPLSKLGIPPKVESQDGKWLALKYLQLNTDISLLQYKYLKCYVKINKIVQKWFSKPQITENDEQTGYKLINHEMDKFHKLENLLKLLLNLRLKFQAKYKDFNKDSNQVAADLSTPSSSTLSQKPILVSTADSSSSNAALKTGTSAGPECKVTFTSPQPLHTQTQINK